MADGWWGHSRFQFGAEIAQGTVEFKCLRTVGSGDRAGLVMKKAFIGVASAKQDSGMDGWVIRWCGDFESRGPPESVQEYHGLSIICAWWLRHYTCY